MVHYLKYQRDINNFNKKHNTCFFIGMVMDHQVYVVSDSFETLLYLTSERLSSLTSEEFESLLFEAYIKHLFLGPKHEPVTFI